MSASTLILILCVYFITHCSSEDCKLINPCSCKNSKGTIDLKALGKNDGKAAYPDNPDGTGQWYYSYNPCNDFSEGSGGCDKVAACQTDQVGSYFSLGDQKSAKFQDDPTNGLQLVYSATTDTSRTSYVTLKCDESTESFTVEGENPPGSAKYYFTLTSKHCCPQAGPGPGPGPDNTGGEGLSGGSIVVIIFFGVAFLYILGGLMFQTFVRKASGREMVPNFGLWSILPGLIRDGFILTFTCGRRSGYGKV
ncbi:cation-dependent mannose-6-phosphate receptor-like [Haliotis cracherodii]|uniref:cation-dependent mannose-6-phosphate receptor-like n=1 Tax=Haliotis cracherodii TaxID=6455 RepID=UPI0039EC1BE4